MRAGQRVLDGRDGRALRVPRGATFCVIAPSSSGPRDSCGAYLVDCLSVLSVKATFDSRGHEGWCFALGVTCPSTCPQERSALVPL